MEVLPEHWKEKKALSKADKNYLWDFNFGEFLEYLRKKK